MNNRQAINAIIDYLEEKGLERERSITG